MAKVPWFPVLAVKRDGYDAVREERKVAMLDDFFWKAFYYLSMNRIQGDYLEFGCGSAMRSFRLAAKYRILERVPMRLFAFDSFAGLPEPEGIDQHPQWRKGGMAVPLDDFRAALREQGVPDTDYQTVAGFYDQTLDGKEPTDYGIRDVAFAYVDCDLHASARSALSFLGEGFADGGILAFDDWYCFNADPAKGEQLAFHEFRAEHPGLKFVEFHTIGWHGRSFIVHRRPGA